MQQVTINPGSPANTQSPKLGASVIRALTQSLLQVLGFGGAAQETFGAPFAFGADPTTGLVTVVADPTDPLGIVPQQYADKRALAVTLSGGPALYTGTSTPAADVTPPLNGLFTLWNQGVAANGPASVALSSTATPIALVRADGSALAAGDFNVGQTVLVVYDATVPALRIVAFIGGSIPNPVKFGTDAAPVIPTTAAGAVPRVYADGTIRAPVRYAMTGPMTLVQGVTTTLVSSPTTPALTVPSDGSYVIHCDYLFNFALNPHPHQFTNFFVTDGLGAYWAPMQWPSNALGPGTIGGPFAAAAGFSPTLYAPGTSLTISAQVYTTEGPDDVTIVQAPLNVPSGFPASYLAVTMMRSA